MPSEDVLLAKLRQVIRFFVVGHKDVERTLWHPSATAVTSIVTGGLTIFSSQLFHVLPRIGVGTGMDYMRVHLVRCLV